MKYLVTLLLLALVSQAKCQTLNYYNSDGPNSWKSITILTPPVTGDKASMIYFNSSVSDKIDQVTTIKQIKQDTISAMYVTIGAGTEKYLIIAPSSHRYIVMSDSRQLFKSIYMLDGNLFNPQVIGAKRAPINAEKVNQLIGRATKILQ